MYPFAKLQIDRTKIIKVMQIQLESKLDSLTTFKMKKYYTTMGFLFRKFILTIHVNYMQMFLYIIEYLTMASGSSLLRKALVMLSLKTVNQAVPV